MVILALVVVLMSETKVIFVLCKSLCSLLILILLLLSSGSPGINEGLEFGVRPLDGQGYRVPRAHR